MSEEIKQKASWAVPWENQLNELLEEKIQDVYNAGSKYLYVYDNTTETYTSCGSEIHTLLNKELGDFINSLLSQALQKRDEDLRRQINENTSDGFHTFKELYEYRLLYNAGMFNNLFISQGMYGIPKVRIHKSKKHNDGEFCFGGGWFIVMAELPTGQISNHYELKDWDLFQVPETEVADKWDGHTPKDVADRLRKFLLNNTTK